MNTEEKQLLTSLFERVRTAASAPRDPEAEALIASAVREQPYSPYLLAQAVLLQEQALKAADTRLHELENQIAALEQAKAEQPAPGFLGGIGASIFGGKTPSGVPSVGTPPPAQPAPSVWGQPRQAAQPQYAPQPSYAPQPTYAPQQAAGGGFLQSAMTTAAGVAGGALLYQGISSLFHTGGGYGGGFGGYGMGGGGYGMGGGQVVNETVYETVNNYAAPNEAPASAAPWASDNSGSSDPSYQDASYDDTSFDSGSDDSGFA